MEKLESFRDFDSAGSRCLEAVGPPGFVVCHFGGLLGHVPRSRIGTRGCWKDADRNALSRTWLIIWLNQPARNGVKMRSDRGQGGKAHSGPRIFLSYRREDSAPYAVHLHENLVSRFGYDNVFLDIASINPGLDFMEVLEETLSQCDVVLVLIGPAWLTVTNSKGQRRLEDHNDLVRLEVEQALAMEAPLVIPVLVGGAPMPSSSDLPECLSGLSWRQALPLSDHRWSVDVGILADHLANDDPVHEPGGETYLGQIYPPSGTVTLLFSDIEGSAALLGRIGEGSYAQVLADNQQVIRFALTAHEGTEIDAQGAGFFAVFASSRNCVEAVAEMQRSLASHEWPPGEEIHVRMGVHAGEVTKRATGLVGLDIHKAARVASAAHGGQVLLSEAAAALVRDFLPDGTSLRDLGHHQLKDLGRSELIFQLDIEGLPNEFPRIRSLEDPESENNLPAQLSSFVGRESELKEVSALVATSRLVTLTGAGGSGKTRLALEVAAEYGSSEGVWLVELGDVSNPDLVVSAMCRALGVKDQPAHDEPDALLEAIADLNLLVVLDNCEHVIASCAKLADAIVTRCPMVHLLVTSREPLGINGETVWPLGPLSLPPDEPEELAEVAASGAVALVFGQSVFPGP